MDVLVFEDAGSPEDAASFAARVDPVLMAHRTATNVIATRLSDAVAGRPTGLTRWYLVEDAGAIVAAAMHSIGLNLMLSPLPEGDRSDIARLLTDVLSKRGDELGALSGSHADVAAFVTAWQQSGGGPDRLIMNEWIHELHHAPAGPPAPGLGRAAGPGDLSAVDVLLRGFYRETFPGRSQASVTDEAVQRVQRGGLMVWECEGILTSLAGLHGPAASVCRIGPVYTAPDFRCRGFGAAVTACAARTGFGRGAEYCMLYTDQSNPTSNRVYARLGFQRVGANVMVSLDSPS